MAKPQTEVFGLEQKSTPSHNTKRALNLAKLYFPALFWQTGRNKAFACFPPLRWLSLPFMMRRRARMQAMPKRRRSPLGSISTGCQCDTSSHAGGPEGAQLPFVVNVGLCQVFVKP